MNLIFSLLIILFGFVLFILIRNKWLYEKSVCDTSFYSKSQNISGIIMTIFIIFFGICSLLKGCS